MLMTMETTNETDRRLSSKELDSLLIAMAARDKTAWEKLYRHTRGAVYAMSLSYLKNPQDASDVTQDAFVRIWENVLAYKPQGSPMAWILTIARNLSLMRLRGEAHKTELSDEEWNAIPVNDFRLYASDDLDFLNKAMSVLSDEERRIILLHVVSGLKHREISQIIEIPLSTVLSKYHRALKKIKVWLKGENIL